MAARKRLPKKTYPEFMSWLEGVECMQPTDWTPTVDQWKTIRTMLGNIIPEVEIETVTTSPAHVAPVPATMIAPSAFGPPVAPPNHVEAVPPSAMMPAAPPHRLVPSALQEAPPAAPGVPAATTTRKDQVLDTSEQDYTSEFM